MINYAEHEQSDDLSKSSAESTDEEIIIAHKNGDREIFRVLLDRYTKPLYNFTARLTNTTDASDIVQEIFIKVWKNINRFDSSKASFKTWIFTIAKNSATDFLRKKKSLLFSDLKVNENEDINSFAENIKDEDMLPDEALEKLESKKENREFVSEILNKLHPIYREVLVLRYQEEMTFDEIGKVLSKPLNTVKSQHRRALIELRKIIAPN